MLLTNICHAQFTDALGYDLPIAPIPVVSPSSMMLGDGAILLFEQDILCKYCT